MIIIPEMFIKGTPKAQPRPKATIRGKHAGVYNPKTADVWKKAIKTQLDEYAGQNCQGSLSLSLWFFLPRPQGHFSVRKGTVSDNVKQNFSKQEHVYKPDLDNLVKAVKDAMTTTGVWNDDSQVVELYARKQYAMTRNTGMSLTLKEYLI